MQPTNQGKTRKIRQISVTNLFGMFNHTIPLNLEERITIVHGPNGFGKTIILKLLNQLFNHDVSELRKIPFGRFQVDFDDNTSLWVEKIIQRALPLEDSQEEEQHISPKIVFGATGQRSFTWPKRRLISPGLIERSMPWLRRVSSDTWQYSSTGDLFFQDDLIEQYGEAAFGEVSRDISPEWLADMRKAVSVRLIETQRLLKLGEVDEYTARRPRFEPTVKRYAKELAKKIQITLAESVSLSQSLDRTFPERVFNPSIARSYMTEEGISVKLIEVEKKRKHLMNVGLLDQEGSPAFQLGDTVDESRKIMLSVYIEDTEKKLGVFDALATKIDLFTDIINHRFLYKHMVVDKDRGFVFVTDTGIPLPLENLSSGEQHELVLFYELLFNVEPGSLILIDEPEISLHIVWQKQFLKDIKKVTSVANMDILIATHSPDIIANRWDLTVKLEGPN